MRLSWNENDPNLYFLIKKGKPTIILLYIDDLLLTRDDSTEYTNRAYQVWSLERIWNDGS